MEGKAGKGSESSAMRLLSLHVCVALHPREWRESKEEMEVEKEEGTLQVEERRKTPSGVCLRSSSLVLSLRIFSPENWAVVNNVSRESMAACPSVRPKVHSHATHTYLSADRQNGCRSGFGPIMPQVVKIVERPYITTYERTLDTRP